jgi:prepilin-type N-terminal cleavage/methylation domain-containing protein
MRDRGFSLVEILIATSLLAGALATLAQFVGAGVESGAAARARMFTALMAEQKLEQLRVLPWSAVAAAAATTDYLDGSGTERCPGATVPCGEAVYVRRWSTTPAGFSTGVVIIEVDVRLIGKGHGSTTIATARARMTP